MHRIDSNGHANNRFVDEDVNNGVSGTTLSADWLNSIQEELINILVAAGIDPLKADNTQLARAFEVLGGSKKWNDITDKPDLVTSSELTTVLDNANIFVLYHYKSTATSATFKILNGIAIDADDTVEVDIYNSSNVKVASKTLTGTSAQGDKEITVIGLTISTNYTAKATLTKVTGQNNKKIISKDISFATDSSIYEIGKYIKSDLTTSTSALTAFKDTSGSFSWTPDFTGAIRITLAASTGTSSQESDDDRRDGRPSSFGGRTLNGSKGGHATGGCHYGCGSASGGGYRAGYGEGGGGSASGFDGTAGNGGREGGNNNGGGIGQSPITFDVGTIKGTAMPGIIGMGGDHYYYSRPGNDENYSGAIRIKRIS